MSANRDRLDEEGNAAGGDAGEVEAVAYPAVSTPMTSRRFPPPWRADKIPGGHVVRDANGQALAYIYSREDATEALQAKMLTMDEARRIAVNMKAVTKLSEFDMLEPDGADLRAMPWRGSAELIFINPQIVFSITQCDGASSVARTASSERGTLMIFWSCLAGRSELGYHSKSFFSTLRVTGKWSGDAAHGLLDNQYCFYCRGRLNATHVLSLEGQRHAAGTGLG
jgi:hypothetical protein